MSKKKAPDQTKQNKITAFFSSRGNNSGARGAVKRKNDGENFEPHQPAKKTLFSSNCMSPDLFQKSTDTIVQNGAANGVTDEFENFFSDDFENDPFFPSPKKKDSPSKKNILQENFSSNEIIKEEISNINFETPVKCKVLEANFVNGKCFEQVLVLENFESHEKGICRLQGVWTSFSFSPEDLVSVEAVSCEGSWVVDNKNGFVILFPDILISSTALVKSMFCMRQGILANFFKDIDSEGNVKMLIGRIIHELFQTSLKIQNCSQEELAKVTIELLHSRNTLHDVFFSGVDISEIEKEIKNFIPCLKSFYKTYVENCIKSTGKNYKGTIDSVLDIEEVIKSPKLGFQGRVDVTVRVRGEKKGEKIAPLELKTGKASFSNEHRSQLILYVLLMNELGREVESGLLLYLRENVMEEIVPTRGDIRNLFLLRNHFVSYCKSLKTYNLPEPIRNVKCCAKCPYLKVCTAYLLGKEKDKISENHPIRSVENSEIKSSHVDYFIKWNNMLWLEFEEVEENIDDSELFKLCSKSDVESHSKHLKYDFFKTNNKENKSLRPGTFVQVLNDKNNRICSGQIVEMTDSKISVLTDKILTDFSSLYKLTVFQSKFLNVYLSNLGWFLREEFDRLRELIIDKKAPKFGKNFDKADFQKKCMKYLLDLNKEQQRAILKALLCQDYLLVKGPPGTGKTQTIVTLIKVLLALDKTVLISSHTHSSVDNILLKLDGVEYLRLGTSKSIHENILKNSYSALRENCSSVDDIKKLFSRKLIASTCLGIDANLIRRIKIDVCILDESSQILQPEALGPLFCCKKFILVGDEDQLPPVVRNAEAKKLGMCQSIFEWLATDEATVTLKSQYRMNSVINSLANAITYKGLIECATDEVANATLKIENVGEEFCRESEWIREILSNKLEKSIVFVDTSEYFKVKNEGVKSQQRCSVLEANIVATLIKSLVKFGMKKNNIGVISPFWDQISLLKTKLSENGLQEVELNTVDQYQGRDKEVILFSCAKENKSREVVSELEILSDERRLTVAVTRAKHKLILLGDKETVGSYVPFQKLFKNLNESQFFCLSDGVKGFSWEKFII